MQPPYYLTHSVLLYPLPHDSNDNKPISKNNTATGDIQSYSLPQMQMQSPYYLTRWVSLYPLPHDTLKWGHWESIYTTNLTFMLYRIRRRESTARNLKFSIQKLQCFVKEWCLRWVDIDFNKPNLRQQPLQNFSSKRRPALLVPKIVSNTSEERNWRIPDRLITYKLDFQ